MADEATQATVETSPEAPGAATQIAEKAADAAQLGMAQYIGPTGELKDGWKDGLLPEDVRGEASWDVFQNLGDILKSHIDTKKLVGRKGVIVPNENSTDDEWSAYYNALGRPANPDGYAMDRPEYISEENWSEELVGEARQLFHKAGFSEAHAKVAVDFHNALVARGLKAQQEATDAAEVLLRGGAGAKYDQILHDTKLMLTEIIPSLPEEVREGATKAMNEAGNKPFMFFLLSKVQEKYDEAKLMTGGHVGGSRGIEQEIHDAMTKKNPDTGKVIYYDANDPGNKRQVEIVTNLFAQKAALTKAKG